MAIEPDAMREVVDALKDGQQARRSTMRAEVSRIDDEGTVWVSIPGGETETPVASADADVSRGDAVTVQWRGNRLYIQGNTTNPSVGRQRVDMLDELANQAYQSASEANANAGIAKAAAESAEASAADAKQTADSVHDIAVQASEDAATASSAAATADQKATAASTAAANAQTAAGNAQTAAQQATADAATAGRAASVAQAAADAAQGDIDDLQEWFWHDTNGSHILGATSGYRNDIDSTGMTIVETATEESVARFGVDGARLGKEDKSHLLIDSDSMKMTDPNGNVYLWVSHLLEDDGTFTKSYSSDGVYSDYYLPLYGSSVNLVSVDGIPTTEYSTQSVRPLGIRSVILDETPAEGSEVTINWTPTASAAKEANAYTLGVRDAESEIGIGSVALGLRVSATENNAVAEGIYTAANGVASHAEGGYTSARGTHSHAEGSHSDADGDYSHAEGSSSALGDSSHAEGNSFAYGLYSHSQNYGTIARNKSQTVLGEYNVEDTQGSETTRGKYAVIIGNGTVTARSNAFTVDWSGGVECAGDFTDGSGNVLSDKADASDVYTQAQVDAALADKADSSDLADYLPLTGGTLSGDLDFGSTSKGVFLVDGSGFSYPAVRDNGSNLWIGARETAAKHHKGGTYISSGHDGSAGKPTIYVSVPNAANNNATNYGVYHTGNKPDLTALTGTLGINHGGTGSDGVDTVTTVSSIISAASGTTISAARYSVWGKFACLSVTFTRTAAWAAHAQVQVGTVVSGKRPTTQVGGGSAGATAGLATGGAIYARNTTGASITAGTATTIGFCYLLP